jgi:hypothetical protein
MGNADDWLLTGEDSGAKQIASERLVKMEAVRPRRVLAAVETAADTNVRQ